MTPGASTTATRRWATSSLLFEALPLQPENGLFLAVYAPEPGSSAVEALARLSALTARRAER